MSTVVPLCASDLRRLAVWGWLVLGLMPAAATAQVHFEVPTECGTPAELEEEARQSVTGVAPGSAIPGVDLRSSVEGFRLQVNSSGAPPRVLNDPDCRVLFRAAVLMVALALGEPGSEPSKATDLPVPPPSPPAQAAATHAAHKTTVAQPARAHSEVPWSAASTLRVGAGLGLVPALAAAVGLDLALLRGRWGLALGARYLSPRAHLQQGVEVRVDGFGAHLSLVYEPLLAIRLGIGGQAFGLRGHGASGVMAQEPDFAWIFGPRADLGWRFMRSRSLDLEVAAAGLYFPDNARFQLSDGAIVYETSHLAAELTVGARWRFL